MANSPPRTTVRSSRHGKVRREAVSEISGRKKIRGDLSKELGMVRDHIRRFVEGDFSTRVPDVGDEVLDEIVTLMNIVIHRNDETVREFNRVTRVLSEEGRLAVRARAEGLGPSWSSNIDALNFVIEELSRPTKEIARVMRAVAAGDLNQRLDIDATGEILEIKEMINRLVATLGSFASEMTRVAREVGTEGRLGVNADVEGVYGTWKDLTDNVNIMASNLTQQLRDVSKVALAVAKGDLSQKITVEAKGEIFELKNTINTMVDQLNSFAAEVTRVAKEVGTEGKLGGQADVKGVSGTWRDLTENVNQLAGNLTNQVRNIALVATAVAKGDLSQKITVEAKGEIQELKDTLNKMVDQLNSFAAEVTRVAKEVGTEGRLGGQAEVRGVEGTWKDLTDNVNQLAGNLTNQVRNIALVTTAVAKGDLSRKITVEAKGEILELKNTINIMVDQLNSFAAEVTRVAREVGTDGKLGGQAQVPGVAGIWKDLTDNVNTMASNLTSQVRGIAKVVTAVAGGDLDQKLLFEAKGEIAALADTINDMTDTLRVFADQVTTVAREVGIEGKLGGQAKVPGASGIWRDLTDNVNQLAGNLTTQVRAITDVATAVTTGDLTRLISVEAQGEVLDLKDNINQMIANLRDTTTTNKEQDWLKTNLAKFTGMMQGQRTIQSLSKLIMNELTPVVSAQYGAFYFLEGESENALLKLISSYAHTRRKNISNVFSLGESLIGQAALEKKTIVINDVPEDYIHIVSGLGEAPPRNIVVLPILFEGQLKGVIELASFQIFSDVHLSFLDQLMQSLGVVFNMISASMRTEELLQELKRSNVELEGRSQELERRSGELELKNREIAEASASLEEKAKELSQISKYKSDFLANMSHELRTPLNSLLILAKMLADNEAGTLTDRQTEFAKTIYSAGNDLLSLINEILDLSKIEAGKMGIEYREVTFSELKESLERSFIQIAREKGVDFQITIDERVPKSLITDGQRLSQILKNLLSNAFKFTEKGSVRLNICLADTNQKFLSSTLQRAKRVIAFEVIDTGIGIPEDKQSIIFDAFQQVDTTTARKYGGTGLGLTISRELVKLLDGELDLKSKVGFGSIFTLYIPILPYNETRLSEPETKYTAFSTPEKTHSLAGKNALIVDDDPRSRYALSKLLENRQMKTFSVESSQECIEYLKSHLDCDFVLLDMVMPQTDGFETAKKIKSIPEIAHHTIIGFSAKSIPKGREKALEAGCAEFLDDLSDSEGVLEAVGRILSAVEPEKAALEESPETVRNLEGRTILLVDDDPRNLFAITSFLESRGANVVPAANANEGISCLKRDSSIEIVLMDIMLPDIDGYEATRLIRKIDEFKHLPVIAVTAKATAEDRKRSQEAGCDDFVPKPVSNERLLQAILKHLPENRQCKKE